MGSLFWLSVNGPWGGGQIFGDDLFKPASMTEEQNDETLQNTTDTFWNITMAMADLQSSGCVFTEYTSEYTGDTIQLDYDEFKAKAIKRKIVFTEEIPESPILLVSDTGNLYEWRP